MLHMRILPIRPLANVRQTAPEESFKVGVGLDEFREDGDEVFTLLGFPGGAVFPEVGDGLEAVALLSVEKLEGSEVEKKERQREKEKDPAHPNITTPLHNLLHPLNIIQISLDHLDPLLLQRLTRSLGRITSDGPDAVGVLGGEEVVDDAGALEAGGAEEGDEGGGG